MSIAELKQVLLEPCRKHSVKRLTVFGSVARGSDSNGSDLDLLVQFEEMPASQHASHYFDLLHELEDATGRPVDLLTSGSVTRSSLKRSISEEGILVYEA